MSLAVLAALVVFAPLAETTTSPICKRPRVSTCGKSIMSVMVTLPPSRVDRSIPRRAPRGLVMLTTTSIVRCLVGGHQASSAVTPERGEKRHTCT